MSTTNNLREGLLNEMNKNHQRKSHPKRKTPQEIVTKEMTRVKRLAWVTVFVWILVPIGFVAKYIYMKYIWAIGPMQDWIIIIPIRLRWPLFLCAVLLMVSLYIRHRTLSLRQINIRLADIEEQLKRLSEAK